MQNPTTEMEGYGSHNVPKGSWSDDTSMTLATIDAIIQDKNINYTPIIVASSGVVIIVLFFFIKRNKKQEVKDNEKDN